MNDRDPELFEAELRKLAPAKPPAELMARLAAARPGPVHAPLERRADLQSPAPATFRGSPSAVVLPRTGPVTEDGATVNPRPLWSLLLRWVAPAAAGAALAVYLLVWWPTRPVSRPPTNPTSPAESALNADAVEIDRELVAAFDAVASLPGGQPVRFRCREWTDEVVLRDSARGIVIEQRMPRLEVVPVSFETY